VTLTLRICLLAIWESAWLATGEPPSFLPDVALVFACLGGVARRRDEDLLHAVVLGLVAGAFTAGPWTLPALVCLTGSVAMGVMRRTLVSTGWVEVLGAASLAVVLAITVGFLARMASPLAPMDLAGVLATLSAIPGTVLLVVLGKSRGRRDLVFR